MALFKSTYFAQIVNKLAGTVFYYSRYGTIIGRNWVMPVDPNTVPQQTVRARFSGAMAAWQGLTAAQRAAWEAFAADTPWQNGLSDDVHLPGMNMYLSIRLAALKIDPTIPVANFDLPPCTPGLFHQELVTLFPCTSGVLQVGFKINIVNHDPVNSVMLGVHMSTAQNTSVNFWKGPYDDRSYFVLGPIAPTFGVSVDKLGLALGKRYFLKLRILDSTNKNHVSSPWHDYIDAAYCAS